MKGRDVKMLSTFKLYGTRIAIDTDSGAVHKLDALEWDMLRYLKFPLDSNCLSTLRYDLAKYESADVAAAFSRFVKMNSDGVFCSEDTSRLSYEPAIAEKSSVLPAETVNLSSKRFVFSRDVLRAVDNGALRFDLVMDASDPVRIDDIDIVESELDALAKEIAKRRLGKNDAAVFEITQFHVRVTKDANGYDRICSPEVIALFESEECDVKKKFEKRCVECALMLYFL